MCVSSGGVHLMHRMRALSGGNRIFSFTTQSFRREIQRLALAAGHPQAELVGTHAFRRGMAQDILDNGGTLATLLRAGGCTSSAFQLYLRTEQIQDTAVGQLLLEVSDSDEE